VNNKNIIVIVGPIASGKGTAIDYLQKNEFTKFSLSDEIRSDFQKKNPCDIPTREKLQDLGDEMRKQNGNEYWAKRIGEKINKINKTKIVIDSVRNPAEIVWFKKNLKANIIAIDCDTKTSIKRAISRARDIDPATNLTKLKQAIKRDLGIDQPEHGQQVKKCIKLADKIITNNGSLQELEEKLKQLHIVS
jgi:dephospho-CoA kinase